MADNVAITPGSGATVAADDIAGVLHQRVKLSIGGDGSATDAVGGAGAVAAGVQRVTLASDDPLVVAATSTAPVKISQADEYETVAASQTDQVLGTTGATGDRLQGIIINPATTSPGTVVIKDGATTIYTFTGGASSVTGLGSIVVGLGIVSVSGAFKITTGANVSVIAVGDFS